MKTDEVAVVEGAVPASSRVAIERPQRLAVLRATGLLDSEVEEAFDRLTRLAVQTLGVAASFISLVDVNRDFYKSACGFGEPLASARELSGVTFCHYTIQSTEPLVIPDAAGDPRYRDVPTVRSLGIGAYVGVPLVIDGEVIGAFCSIEMHARVWSDRDVGILRDLAAMALSEIELRSAKTRSEASARDLALANQQLEDQQVELEMSNQQLEDQQVELEMTNQQLQDSAAELEMQAERLAQQAEAARREHHRVETVLASISDAFFVLDAEWRFSYVNDRTEEVLFTTREALLGRSIWEVYPETIGSTFEREYRRAAATRLPSVFEEYYPPLDIWFEVRVFPAADGLSVYYQDVSERHRANEALRESLRRAEQAELDASKANLAKSEFLATMSHELRTPLNAILGYTNLFELEILGGLSPEQRRHLDRLRSSAEHLLALVNDVLDISKLEAGEMVLDSVMAHVEDAVRVTLDLAAPAAVTRGVRLVHEPPTSDAAAFVGDEMRVRQILLNLVSNAVKFTDSGGEVEISSRVTTDPPNASRLSGAGPWTAIIVRDTGIGIAPEHHAGVFEPFKQVVGGHTRVQGGTGLGLAISRRLARQMGGDIQLESTVGVGSSFSLWLPAAGSSEGITETPAARSIRARKGDPEHRLHGLAEIGSRLRDDVEKVLESVVARLRARLGARVGALPPAELEDHNLAFLVSLAQSLVIVDQTGGIDSRLMEDSQRIQRLVSTMHGAQRYRIGWSEADVAEEFAAIEGELSGRIGQLGVRDPDDAVLATGIIVRLLTHARGAAVEGYCKARAADS